MNNRVSLLPTVRAAAGALVLTLASVGVAGAQTNGDMTAQPMQPAPPMNAQPAPPMGAQPATPPSYSAPAPGETISGHITAVTGKYTLQLRDNRGFIDNVVLHQGTIINPRGLTLAPGMQVSINGSNAGSAFQANQIDAPYTVALVPGYGYAAPFYGSLGIGFGGWGWGPRFRGGFWW
jgi:hypothetical protein